MALKSGQQKTVVGFKSVQVLEDQKLYIGGYGVVCKAKCDDLLCAAKMLHPALISPDYGLHNPLRRFQREFETLSTLRHPNIVQYIGVYRGPETQGVVLLMELVDENLTRYLERCSLPVPYHLQLSICHDVALALSYLHANDIVHLDIRSNTILLTNSAQVAKLCNFRSIKKINMAIFDPKEDALPGSFPYAPPEVMGFDPKCTDKIDCFSFGVVVIQILTGRFPNPSDRILYGPDHSHPICVPEIERRKNHISMVDPSHHLLPVALDCLNDKDMERPTAHQLCERVKALKLNQGCTEPEKKATDLHEQLQRERRQQECNEEEIQRLREEIKQKDLLVEEVFENAKQQQRLAVEREVQNERRRISQLEQQLLQNQEETGRTQQELTQQLRQEQLQSSQREYELRCQIVTEQQRSARERDESRMKEMRIRELEQRLEQSDHEMQSLGSRVTGLQLLPQGDLWNVPRRDVQIVEQIGFGAAGLVSKGRHQGQEVAVKQIHREILREKHIMDEFKREVGIMATIQHPNLVRFIAAVFDEQVEQLRETPLLVLELLHTNLRDAYKDYNLGPSKSVPIFRDVAYGLHYLHEHSEPIIHRDVSAPNILLESLPGDAWRAKLSDFGSANFLKRAKTLGVGAIVYTAPEMFPREGPSAPMPRPTTKCDVFSYGIVLVEVVTKTMPTTENRHQLFGEVERKWRLMYNLVSRCTEVSPHARPTMADVLNTLNRIPTARPR